MLESQGLCSVRDKKFKDRPDAKWSKRSGALRVRPHPASPAACERKRPEEPDAQKHQGVKATECKCNLRRGPGSSPSRVWQPQAQGSRIVVNTSLNRSLLLRKVTEPQHVLGSLYLEAQREHFMKAMKGKPGCTGDPKLLEIPEPWMGCLPRKAANREWNQPKTEKQDTVNKEGRWREIGRALRKRREVTGFGGCPAGFQSRSGPVSPHHAPCLLLGMTISILCHCVWKYVIFLLSLQGLQVRDCLESQKRL